MTAQSADFVPHRKGWHLKRLLAIVLAACLIAAACGDDDDNGDASDGADVGTTDTGTADEGTADEGDDAMAEDEGTAADEGDDAMAEDEGTDVAMADGCTEENKGGELNFGLFLGTRSLDPTVAGALGSSGGIEHAAFYDTLIKYDPATGEYLPHVAESFESNADYTEWTVVLRPGVEFGNGDLLTAEIAKASIDRFRTSTTASGAGSVAAITDIEVVDDLTMKFMTPGGFTYLPFVLASEVGGIVNTAIADERGEDFGANATGAGVGPYELERFALDEELVLTAKDNYWGGPVCIDTLRFVNITGAQGTYDAFRNGELQAGFIREAKVIADAKDAGVTGLSNTIGAGTIVLLNNAIEPLNDVRIRQAMAAGLDLSVLNDQLEDGKGLPSSQLVPEGFPVDPGVPGPAYDADAAMALVEEAKADGWDGKLNLKCGPLQGDMPIVVEGLLEAVGFDVDAEVLDTNALINAVFIERTYQAACWAINIFPSAPGWALRGFGSDFPTNTTGYANPDMDAAIAALNAAVGVDEVKAALATVQEIWNDTIPSINVFSLEEFVMVDPSVHGLEMSSQSVVLFHDAYIG